MSDVNKKIYTYADLRSHRSTSDAWVAIHGKVYDITKFLDRHPGGAVINTSLGRDGTVLYETHHNLVDDIKIVEKTMAKYQIGIIENYKPIARFDSPFALAMIKACKEGLKGIDRRDSLYGHTSLMTFFIIFALLVYIAFTTGSLWVTFPLGLIMSIGHLAGHAGNHWSLSRGNWINRLASSLCTSLWGLREKYWEFSHLISHHCYNYTDRDYIMEQHVPLKYFRVRESDPWRPIHAYQHYTYLTTPITAFFMGALRLDCAPFIFLAPFLQGLRRNNDSPAPAPQFFASGSNVDEDKLRGDEDGVGPYNFVVFDTIKDSIKSLILSNIIWLPLFYHTYNTHGLTRAILLNGMSFGFQAMIITRSLLTQHLCEDIKLEPSYSSEDDWYAMQVEASTSIHKNKWIMWLTYAISFQTEHHMFPSLNPIGLVAIQQYVHKISLEYKLRYNNILSDSEATKSVYQQFKKLSVKPVAK